MIKKFMYVILFFSVIIIVKFFTAQYSISYVIEDFNIKEEARNGTMYFEITYDNKIYNYMFYNSRKLTKKRIKSVKVEKIGESLCLTPDIKGIDSYSVCHDGTSLVSEHILKDKNYDNKTEDFYYSKKLNKNEFVLIWKYDGFYYMNEDEQKSINIFNKDRYSNDLMYQKDKFLIFPKYSDAYLFSDFVVLDMTSGDYKYITTDYKINYNSKVVGEHNNSIYLFDYTSNKLYEVNYKKRRCKLVGDEIKGYIKYENGRKKEASLNNYIKENYTFFEDDNKYLDVDKNYFSYCNNNSIKFRYFKDDNIKFVDSYKNNLYFVSDDNLLKYTNNSVELLVHYFELNFNSGNVVFVYNK